MARIGVEYWEKWGGGEWDAMAAITRAFNASQDAYAVVMVPAGDWPSSPDLPRFLRALDEGTPPDLIGLENHQITDLASQGALAPPHCRARDALRGWVHPRCVDGVRRWIGGAPSEREDWDVHRTGEPDRGKDSRPLPLGRGGDGPRRRLVGAAARARPRAHLAARCCRDGSITWTRSNAPSAPSGWRERSPTGPWRRSAMGTHITAPRRPTCAERRARWA